MTLDLRKEIHRDVTCCYLTNYIGTPVHINVADDGTYESSTLSHGDDSVEKPDWSVVGDQIMVRINEREYLPIRQMRDKLLSECDWTLGPDSPLSDEKKEEWRIYRQALRDLPSNVTNIDKVFWPDKPE